MRALTLVLALSVAWLAAAMPAAAQEGHPLKGSWIGTWAANNNHGNDLLLVLNWDGKNITGTINPGTDNIADQERHAQSRGLGRAHRGRREGQGRATPLTYVIDGKIENLPLANRTVTGTWKNQGENGAFKIARQ